MKLVSRGATGLADMPRASGALARLACAHARREGVALAPLLRKANLTQRQLNDTHATLPARDQIRLLNLIAAALRDDRLGFHIGQRADLREVGLLYYVIASSATLLEAVRRGVRYSVVLNDGVLQRCTVGRQIEVQLTYHGISRHSDQHQPECWMAFMLRTIRQITGQRIAARRVRFVHSRAGVPRDFSAHFGCEVEFGAGVDQISFARASGAQRVVSADPYLNRQLERYFEEALARRRPGRDSFRMRVENTIVPLLPHAQARASEIARQLGLSLRTLTRRLKSEDLTFSGLLDSLRLALAHRYLADRETSISQVAWLLGYQDGSAFSKAFRRWTGKPPRVARGRAS
jgi:AraC-like DNA-binding protein